MHPIIKSSSELRKNYNSVAEICRTHKTPVFLTRNGEGDTVLMDIETYSRREEDLDIAQRFLVAERARLEGTRGYTVDEFGENMRKAIKKGVSSFLCNNNSSTALAPDHVSARKSRLQ